MRVYWQYKYKNEMNKDNNEWTRHLYALWIGGALPLFAGVGPQDLAFWLVIAPALVLYNLFNQGNCE